MKSLKPLNMLIALAVLAAPAVAYAHPTSVPARGYRTTAHRLTAHVDHTEQVHTRTISAHHTHNAS
ncbi:hypothetical protein GOB94_07480 [Granulicella sp. 5B5]|uniref:hypothetical protein n=1 Tax=Granulicella sp. 5B5 TaxID=1617967 RepID=UPI0015F3D747|nr:hypothetical protein [Granulicella sp. 5B5]QMV18543.1 hypothetical protein GOB94_07480 [Granulicella sp. 5B5]